MSNFNISQRSGLNQTPSGERITIGFFGKRNSGKSSIVNALTGQNLSIVSDVKGTTTDPVSKAMELLPIGPVLIIDTPGIDDSGEIGEMRISKTYQVLHKAHVAVLVVNSVEGISEYDTSLISEFNQKSIPFIVVYNKIDTADVEDVNHKVSSCSYPAVAVSTKTGRGIDILKDRICQVCQSSKFPKSDRRIVGDMINQGDIVLLVTPIDGSAPRGRMILPQVQTLRDILDSRGCPLFTQVEQLRSCISCLKEPPKLVITDSQVFSQVQEILPDSVPLTSFSILFARYKGVLKNSVSGALCLENLNTGDNILISEGCTHHRQCEDIGTVKLPRWIEEHTGKTFNFSFTSGNEFSVDLKKYKLIIHCGGCMLNEREVKSRMDLAVFNGISFTNYGTLIAHINGILQRSIDIFNDDL